MHLFFRVYGNLYYCISVGFKPFSLFKYSHFIYRNNAKKTKHANSFDLEQELLLKTVSGQEPNPGLIQFSTYSDTGTQFKNFIGFYTIQPAQFLNTCFVFSANR